MLQQCQLRDADMAVLHVRLIQRHIYRRVKKQFMFVLTHERMERMLTLIIVDPRGVNSKLVSLQKLPIAEDLVKVTLELRSETGLRLSPKPV